MIRRALAPSLAALAAAACGEAAPAGAVPGPPAAPAPLSILVANVGNLDEANGGPCPAAPYHGALCSIAQETSIGEKLAALQPDLVVLLEVLEARHCEGVPDGDPDWLCTGAATREPAESARRLVGEGYSIVCDGIEGYDCLAVRDARVTMSECPPGATCPGAAFTPPHPEACGDRGGITSVSSAQLTVDGLPLRLVVLHPLNATARDPDRCRAAQYRQAFEELAGDGPTIVAGDFNFDPYRFPDAWESGPYFHEVVGEGHRFQAISVGALDPPLTTWLELVTLDYVVADFGPGSCSVLGVSPGTERIDEPQLTMDHRAVLCALALPPGP